MAKRVAHVININGLNIKAVKLPMFIQTESKRKEWLTSVQEDAEVSINIICNANNTNNNGYVLIQCLYTYKSRKN